MEEAGSPPPLCDSADGVARLDGHVVRLVGIYTPVQSLKKMPRPGEAGQQAWLGRVAIEVDGRADSYDRTAASSEPARIALGTEVRGADEIERLRGRRVSVEGRLVLAPPVPQGVAAPKPEPVLMAPGRVELLE